jgi:hypothetical protein
MALDMFGPINKVVNQTAQKALDQEIPKRVSGVVTTLVDGVFNLVTSVLEQTVEVTSRCREILSV